MSSDLPEMRFETGREMARVLVTYMDDPRAIQAAVKCEFAGAGKLDLSTIRALRKAHLESLLKPAEEPVRANDGYYPGEHSERMAATSRRFLAALERERLISVEWAKSMGALDSPSLRRPEIVDRAWEREIEAAWRRNTERFA